jgi:hypothetical protein
MQVDKRIGPSRLSLSRPEFDQQLIARQFLLLELAQAFASLFNRRRIERSLCTRPALLDRI